MAAPGEEAARLVKELFVYDLARPILQVLSTGPKRHRDLVASLNTSGHGIVYTRTLHNAVHFLSANGLIVREHQPRYTVYTITDVGLSINEFLKTTESMLQERHGKHRGRPGGDHGDP